MSSNQKSDRQRYSFNVQCLQQENQVTPCCYDPGIHSIHTLRDIGMHILWQDINTLPSTMHIHCVEQTSKGKVSTHMFYNDWSCNIHPLNSVELAVIDKHQGTNVRIMDFVIVKYGGTFYLREVLHLVPNQSATVSTMEHSGFKFWKYPITQDILDYPLHDIKPVIKHPTIVSNCGAFSVPELEYV